MAQHGLADVAAKLDETLRKCQPPSPDLITRYEQLRRQYSVQIAHYLADAEAASIWETPVENAVNLARARKLLTRLSAAISANQFVPDDELQEIAKALPLEFRQKFWPPVEQAVDTLDFENAAQALANLRDALERL